MGSPASVIAGSFRCCGRGLEGMPGQCIHGTTGSICSAGDIPLLCDAGSTAYLNGNGHPFCCGPSFTGCDGVCVGPNRRDSILMSGRQCNDVAPQGLQTPGLITYFGIPWDGQLQRYRCGSNAAKVDGIAMPRGTDDFTVTATITPRRDGQIAFGRYATLLFRRQSDVNYPIALYIGYDSDLRHFEFYIAATANLSNSVEGITPEYDNFRAKVPVTFKFIRQRSFLIMLANDTVIQNDSFEEEIFNLDNSLGFPIEIGPPTFPITNTELEDILSAMDADVSDIAISDSAEIPPMVSQLSR